MSVILSLTKDSGNTGDFTTRYSPPIPLGYKDSKWQVALVQANLWYSWYNIAASLSNNTFTYTIDGTPTVVTIPDGIYNVEDINKILVAKLVAGGTFDPFTEPTPPIQIIANYNTLKVEIVITNTNGNVYTVDLNTSKLWYVFGFDQAQVSSPLTVGVTAGNNTANITNDLNSLQIRCDLLAGSGSSFSNANQSEVLFEFVPKSPPGSSITVSPSERVYLNINQSYQIHKIRVYITSQSGKAIDFNGEDVSILLHLQKIN